MAVRNTSRRKNSTDVAHHMERRGMVLPFKPLSLACNHVNYYIYTPIEMKHRGFKDNQMQLLKDVSGAFRPRILTALIDVNTKTHKSALLALYSISSSTKMTPDKIHVTCVLVYD
nr:plant PDR ABC transporter associated [Tanacetum cinerariifolium]